MRERECGLVDWVLDWAMVDLMILSLVGGWTSSSLLAYRDSLLSKDTLRSNDGRVYDLPAGFPGGDPQACKRALLISP